LRIVRKGEKKWQLIEASGYKLCRGHPGVLDLFSFFKVLELN